MQKFILSTESTCDLRPEYCEQQGVRVIKMEYFVNGEPFGGDTDKDMTDKEFYNKMREGAKTSTSMINEARAEEFFRTLMKEDKDILHVAFASVCSGTYACMKSVADRLNKEYDHKIYVVDSKAESTGEGLIVDLAIAERDGGKEAEEVVSILQDKLTRVNLLFTVDNLKYLAAGGRVSKASAIIGNIAKIKPLLYVDDTGKLTVGSKTLGRKNSLTKLANMSAEKFNGECDRIYVSHADCEEDADFVIQKIKNRVPSAEIIKEKIGYVIGSHSGPGTLAIFFMGHDRKF